MSQYVTKYVPSKDTIKARTTTLKAWELPKQGKHWYFPHTTNSAAG